MFQLINRGSNSWPFGIGRCELGNASNYAMHKIKVIGPTCARAVATLGATSGMAHYQPAGCW